MSLESDFFKRHRPVPKKLEAAGFRRAPGGYSYEEDFLDGQFRAVLTVSDGGEISGRVIDLDTEEEYLPIRARDQIGEFVGSVRQGYFEVLAQVREKGFSPVDFIYDQANRIAAAIEREFDETVEFPWEKYPGNGTIKCSENGKWYAAVLTVARGKLDTSGVPAKAGGFAADPDPEEIVEVINLKADPDEIPELIHEAGICRAWHMNKKHWISVLLDDTAADARVMELVRESRRLVAGKARAGHVSGSVWIIPSNPKVYDIDTEFAENGGSIDWHQHNNIKPGDTVYIYSAAPNSAILYRCEVEASDISYHGIFEESREYTRAMRLRLMEKYPKTRFPLAFMKEHGGSAVRSARRMPEELLEAMKWKTD